MSARGAMIGMDSTASPDDELMKNPRITYTSISRTRNTAGGMPDTAVDSPSRIVPEMFPLSRRIVTALATPRIRATPTRSAAPFTNSRTMFFSPMPPMIPMATPEHMNRIDSSSNHHPSFMMPRIMMAKVSTNASRASFLLVVNSGMFSRSIAENFSCTRSLWSYTSDFVGSFLILLAYLIR